MATYVNGKWKTLLPSLDLYYHTSIPYKHAFIVIIDISKQSFESTKGTHVQEDKGNTWQSVTHGYLLIFMLMEIL